MVLGKEPTESITGSVGAAEKNNINFSETNTKFCLSLFYNCDKCYLYVNKTKTDKVKAQYNKSWYNFCLRSISKDFTKN